MNGFRTLVNPPTKNQAIDTEVSKCERDRIHAAMRQRTGEESEAMLHFLNRMLMDSLRGLV